MKLKNIAESTYKGYLHDAWYAADAVDEVDIIPMLWQFNKLPGLGYTNMAMFLSIDYTQKKYISCSDGIQQVLGFEARDLLENGIDFTIDIFQKEYFKIFNEKTFPATLEFLKNRPQDGNNRYIFSVNYKMKQRSGKYIDIMQKSTYITCKETNRPLYCVAMGLDVSDFKKGPQVTQTVQKVDMANGSNILIDTNHFYPFEEDALLTPCEKNVLNYMADGLSTKMIADKLHISENTVSNHRQNMMRKTNTKNVAQLIAFVIKKNII